MLRKRMLQLAAGMLAMFLFVGCGTRDDGLAKLTGTVTQIDGSIAVIEADEANPQASFVSPVQISISDELKEQLAVGSKVEVTFSGESTKDYPAHLIGVTEIRRVEA